MLKPRIIPFLSLYNGGLVKTRRFVDKKYVGDPINIVRIFNEKEVDELVVSDIGVSTEGGEIDFKLIESLANNCRMPLCYCGGIRNVEEAERIIKLGVEKIGLSSAAVANYSIVEQCAKRLG